MSEDFGIKVSLAGKDVDSAGDSELLFSSSWPIPKILFQGRIKNSDYFEPGVANASILVKHNLKFVPMFMFWDATNDELSIFRTIVSADDRNIYLSQSGGGAGIVAFDIGLFIFDVDIEKNFTAPNINTGTSSSTGIDRDFGIKMSKPGKSVSSHDLRDFILHSSTRSPLLHAVSCGPPNASNSVDNTTYGDFTYEHNLPYNPIFLAYAKEHFAGRPPAYQLNTSFSGINTQNKTITYKGLSRAADSRVSIVVLKDPFEIDVGTKVS